MEALKRQRSVQRKKLVRLTDDLKEEMAKDPIERRLVLGKWTGVQTAFSRLTRLDEEVDEMLRQADVEEEVFEAEDLSRDVYIATFNQLEIDVDSLRTNGGSGSDNGDARSVAGERKKFRLPKIELPVFDGQLKSWLNWWAQFEKIDGDGDIDEADKFGFLMQSVAKGTEAYQAISSYPRTGGNYKLAIADMKDRYGQPDLLLQVYVRDLLQLVITNVNSEEKLPLPQLCSTLESNLRSLAVLQLQSSDPAVWLFPLVESSLPEETLRAWQHSSLSKKDGSTENPPKSRLDLLREFMKTEVKNEQRITLARSGFQSSSSLDRWEETSRQSYRVNEGRILSEEDVPTAAGLLSASSAKRTCIFCQEVHQSSRCTEAESWTQEEKISTCQKRGACFKCLRSGHISRECRTPVKCEKCGGDHYAVMCCEAGTEETSQSDSEEEIVVGEKVQQTVSHECTPNILLNTMKVNLVGEGGKAISIRLVGDTGSQRSYITTEAVKRGKSAQVGAEFLQSIVFGGRMSAIEKHEKYDVVLKPPLKKNSPRYRVKLLVKRKLCGKITSVPEGPWMQELQEKKIELSDVGGSSSEVQILLGNDYWPHIITGRIVKLDCGLVATETVFGWTLGGRLPQTALATTVASSLSVTVSDQRRHVPGPKKMKTLKLPRWEERTLRLSKNPVERMVGEVPQASHIEKAAIRNNLEKRSEETQEKGETFNRYGKGTHLVEE